MRAGLGIAMLLFTAAAHARPVVVEQTATFGTPDPAYAEFATDVAIDGNFAVVTAARSVPDSAEVPGGEKYLTAFLFARDGNTWSVVRRLAGIPRGPDVPDSTGGCHAWRTRRGANACRPTSGNSTREPGCCRTPP